MYTQSVKTTVQIDPDIYYLVKQLGLKQGKTFRDLINEALLKIISEPTKPAPDPNKIKIGGYHLGGVIGNLSRDELYDELWSRFIWY